MLKKPSVFLSSHINLHSHYWAQPAAFNVWSPHYPQLTSPRSRSSQWRSFSSPSTDETSADQVDDLQWPKLPSATVIPTPYEILHIKKGAPYLKRRFYELAKIYHPDSNSHEGGHLETKGLSGAVKMERYRLVVTAHEILSDPVKRSAYDSTGAGWNGRPEHGAPRYHWGQNTTTRWTGFDTNDSPFRNATWEDWERWYQRDKAKQQPVYFSNGGFLVLVIAAVFLGGFGQSLRVGDYSDIFQRQVEMVHDDASKALLRRKTESAGFGNRDERLQSFLKSRDPHGYGIADATEEGFRKLLPEPETCLSDEIHQQGHRLGAGQRPND